MISLGTCGLAAVVEALLSGKRPMQVLATLRLPRFTPAPWIWVAIGVFYYAICCTVLARLLRLVGNDTFHYCATVLLIVLLVLNPLFNYLLFTLRNPFTAFLVFIPYDCFAVALLICLFRVDSTAAYLFVPYVAYLIFATVWGYQLWRLNEVEKQRVE